jgi:hypothetical protein
MIVSNKNEIFVTRIHSHTFAHTFLMPTYNGQKVSYRKMISNKKLYEIKQKQNNEAYRVVNEFNSQKRECCLIM